MDGGEKVFVGGMEEDMVGEGRVHGGAHADCVTMWLLRTIVVKALRQIEKRRVVQNSIHKILEDYMSEEEEEVQ